MSLALVRCSIEADQGGTPNARARVSLVSWNGRSHALLFMVTLGLPSARPMVQALWLPFEYYYYYYYYCYNYYYYYKSYSMIDTGTRAGFVINCNLPEAAVTTILAILACQKQAREPRLIWMDG